jgi:hypothetical protein
MAQKLTAMTHIPYNETNLSDIEPDPETPRKEIEFMPRLSTAVSMVSPYGYENGVREIDEDFAPLTPSPTSDGKLSFYFYTGSW